MRTYLGFLLAELQDHNATELTAEIRQLHRLGVVDESIAGNEKNLEFRQQTVPEPPSIFERYQALREGAGEDSPFNPDADAVRVRKALEEQKRRRAADAAAVQQASRAQRPAATTPAPAAAARSTKSAAWNRAEKECLGFCASHCQRSANLRVFICGPLREPNVSSCFGDLA